MDPKIHEGGDSSDSELLDNWTILDTDEALDASLLADDEAEEQDDSEKDPPRPDDELPEEPADDNICESLKDDPIEDQEKSSSADPVESDTDGISTFSESDGEEGDLEVEMETARQVVPPAASIPEDGRISPGSKSLGDFSDLSSLQDMPIDLGQKGERRYVHHPNPKVNLFLNALLVVVFASVVGLGIGHFMGLQEECHIPKFAELSETPLSAETWTLLNSLSHENDLLKMQLKQLQNSMDEHKQRDQLVLQPLLIKNEEDDVNLATDTAATVDDSENNNVPVPERDSSENNATVHFVPEEATQKIKQHKFDPADPYSDEQLESFQTRFVKQPESPKPVRNEKPQFVKQPEADKSGERKQKPPPSDSFYGRAEAELQGLLQRLTNYGSSIVNNRNIPQSVSSGLGMLTATVADLQQSVKKLQQNTAQHSTFVVENVKKSVSKMVSNVKHTAEKLTSGKLGPDGNIWKSIQKLKASVVNGWCHIKGKTNQGDCYKKNDTKFQKQDYKFKKQDRQPHHEKHFYNKKLKQACHKGRCVPENPHVSEWQFKRAQFRDQGRQKDSSTWWHMRADGRQHRRNDYRNGEKRYRSRGY